MGFILKLFDFPIILLRCLRDILNWEKKWFLTSFYVLSKIRITFIESVSRLNTIYSLDLYVVFEVWGFIRLSIPASFFFHQFLISFENLRGRLLIVVRNEVPKRRESKGAVSQVCRERSQNRKDKHRFLN